MDANKCTIFISIITFFSSCHDHTLDHEKRVYFSGKNMAIYEKSEILFAYHMKDCHTCIDYIYNELEKNDKLVAGVWLFADNYNEAKMHKKNKIPHILQKHVYIDTLGHKTLFKGKHMFIIRSKKNIIYLHPKNIQSVSKDFLTTKF